MNEKNKAMELLAAALTRMDDAMKALEALAKANDIQLGDDEEKPKAGAVVTMPELAKMVSQETGFSGSCVEEIISTAFKLAIENDLRIDGELDDE